MYWVLIGNPDNRRITLFDEALRSRGEAPPLVLAHEQLLEDVAPLRALDRDDVVVRLDSCGEHDVVTRALLARGYERARAAGVEAVAPDELGDRPRHGEIVAPTQQHFGYLAYLDELAEVFAARPAWRVLQPPRAVAEVFDKRAVHARLGEAGLPVADALPEVATPDELRAAMEAADARGVFVKHRYSSSASCLGMYHSNGTLMTTVKERDGGRFNSLRVQRCEGERAERVLAFLLAEGAHIERAHAKARLDGAVFDVRVLVVDDEPVFTVVRQSRHPITNLHLGGWRGDPTALAAWLGERAHGQLLEAAARAARTFGLFHAGVDVLVEPDRKVRILEINAFGDLLPNLERDGLDVYQWQIERVRAPA